VTEKLWNDKDLEKSSILAAADEKSIKHILRHKGLLEDGDGDDEKIPRTASAESVSSVKSMARAYGETCAPEPDDGD
jgi:hypothetical protein